MVIVLTDSMHYDSVIYRYGTSPLYMGDLGNGNTKEQFCYIFVLFHVSIPHVLHQLSRNE